MKTGITRLALSLLLLITLAFAPNAKAVADELAVEHVTTTPYRVGDMVAVPDLDGEVFPLEIIALRLAEGVAEFRTQAGKKVEFPISRIREKAGWMLRFGSWLRDTTGGNWTAVGTTALVGGVAAKETLDVSEKDEVNRVDAATAKAMADSAAQSAERNTAERGPSDGAGFYISGTFTGSPLYVATGSYTPSITFSIPSGPSGGRIAKVNVAPDASGQAQEQRDVGEWSTVSRSEISLKGLPEAYAGTATLQGVTPYGSAVYKTATLVLRSGITLQGGQVIEANPPQGSVP